MKRFLTIGFNKRNLFKKILLKLIKAGKMYEIDTILFVDFGISDIKTMDMYIEKSFLKNIKIGRLKDSLLMAILISNISLLSFVKWLLKLHIR